MIALVVPCFNESERLDLDYWRSILNIEGVTVYFVDDASTDSTRIKLNELIHLDNCSVLSSPKNLGKANAIRYGIQHIQKSEDFSSVGYIDADGAFELNDISRIIEVWEKSTSFEVKFDSIWASRVKLSGREIERNPYRHYIARILATYMSAGNSKIPYDTQCGFKLFKNDYYLKYALEEPFQTRWFLDLELLARIFRIKEDYKIYEEPLNAWKEISGSKVRKAQYIRILYEILLVKKNLNKI